MYVSPKLCVSMVLLCGLLFLASNPADEPDQGSEKVSGRVTMHQEKSIFGMSSAYFQPMIVEPMMRTGAQFWDQINPPCPDLGPTALPMPRQRETGDLLYEALSALAADLDYCRDALPRTANKPWLYLEQGPDAVDPQYIEKMLSENQSLLDEMRDLLAHEPVFAVDAAPMRYRAPLDAFDWNTGGLKDNPIRHLGYLLLHRAWIEINNPQVLHQDLDTFSRLMQFSLQKPTLIGLMFDARLNRSLQALLMAAPAPISVPADELLVSDQQLRESFRTALILEFRTLEINIDTFRDNQGVVCWFVDRCDISQKLMEQYQALAFTVSGALNASPPPILAESEAFGISAVLSRNYIGRQWLDAMLPAYQRTMSHMGFMLVGNHLVRLNVALNGNWGDPVLVRESVAASGLVNPFTGMVYQVDDGGRLILEIEQRDIAEEAIRFLSFAGDKISDSDGHAPY